MEWCVSDCGKYKVESITASTFSGGLDVIRKGFCEDESVCIGSEVNLNPPAIEELLELCAYAALDGVSLAAIDVKTNEVAAVAFNKIQLPNADTNERPFFDIFAEERCNEESSRSLIKFMANIDERCNLFEKYNADCSLEIMFLATMAAHRNQGLGTLLCKASLEVCRKLRNTKLPTIKPQDLGPQFNHIPPSPELKTYPKICQAIFTSNISQAVGKKIGFNEDIRVPYTEFEFKGITYATRIGPSAPDCALVSIVL